MRTVYLDNAATTPLHPEVIETITTVMKETYGNPSSTHQFGRKARALVEAARKDIAKVFNVGASEVVFTSGGSEADNLILRNAVENLAVTHIITSKIEHHAVLYVVEALEKEFDIQISYVDLNTEGEVNLEHLESLLEQTDQTTMVSLMAINNELGAILDISKVCELCNKHQALFHSDTVQVIGHYTLDLQKTPVDFITASAHKFHGPKGVGFAIIKKGFGIKPMLIGGEQERGARAGTENVHNICGMNKALELAMNNLDEDRKRIKALKKYFIEHLNALDAGISYNGASDNLETSTYITLNVRFAKDLPMLLFNLDLKGIAASGGSACQSGSTKGSHVLNTILPKEEAQKTSVRFSLSVYTTKEDIDYVIEVLKSLI